MKKLKLKLEDFKGSTILDREQLKNVKGGTVVDCDNSGNCPAGFECNKSVWLCVWN